MSAPWRINPDNLRVLQGMIIDRDTAWRADEEMAPVIEAAIRAGIENIDADTFSRIHAFLRSLWGNYETYGFGDEKMSKAWRRYLKKHKVQPADT